MMLNESLTTPVTQDVPVTAGAGGALPDAGADRALAAWEIASVVTSAMIAEWVVLALARSKSPVILLPVALAFALMLASRRARGETARDLGLRLDNFTPALRLLLPPMSVITAALLLLGWLGGTIDFLRWRGGWSVFGLPTLGLAWAIVQQYALQCFINRRAQIIWGQGPRSVLLVAAVFALLHLPNPLLTAVTFAGGVAWAATYQREPNLWALAVSHSLMTWVLVSAAPQQLLNSLRVGYKFFGLFF